MNDQVVQTLQTLEVSPATATLSLFDGSVDFQFLVNPERMVYSLKANYASLPVLHTSQPLVSYQHSIARVSFPDVKFFTDGNRRDLSDLLDTLKQWTRPDETEGRPKLLKFIWGEVNVPRCHLESLDYSVTQWRSGRPTKAEGSLGLILAPDPPQPLFEEVEVELTEREQEETATQVTEAAQTDESVIDALGWDGEAPITVGADSEVFLGGQATGVRAGTLLGDTVISPAVGELSGFRTSR